MVGAPVGVFEEAALTAFDLAFSVNGTLVRRSLGSSWDTPFELLWSGALRTDLVGGLMETDSLVWTEGNGWTA